MAYATLAVMAAYVTFGVVWRRAQQGLGEMAYDFYGLFYPNIVYALERLAAGDHGLLWTPYQACGLPFLANSQVALFYPGHVVFALLPREAAVLASVLIHLLVAGLGVFFLCRAIGLRPAAALAAALAFQLGSHTIQFAGWGPIHLGTYAWMSVAAWRAERLVQTPSARNVVALAIVLALQLLAGFIQMSYFTYGLVMLRVAWAVVTRERPLALAAAAVPALVLGAALAAVLLVPAFEMVSESIRARALGPGEIGPGASWPLLLATVRSLVTTPFNVLVALLVALAVVTIRRAGAPALLVFWGLLVAGCLVLSMGPGSGLWELYVRLPLAGSFRGSGRLLWIAHLAFAVLVGFGADALARGLGRAALLLPLAMIVNSLAAGAVPYFGYRPDIALDQHADAFAFVRTRLTPQDRVHVVGKPRDVTLGPKSPSRFSVPGIYDYEAQPPRRYAEYFTYVRLGRTLRRLTDWHWILDQQLPPTLQRPLFDRTAARYLLVDRDVDTVPAVFHTGVRAVAEIGGVRIYENTQAVPRARWVASASTAPDGDTLRALASGAYDARETVLLDQLPPGIDGARHAGEGTATIAVDEPERVVIRVQSSAPGFLVLADAFYPGWTATVNGLPVEILHAEHAFRAVAVAAGGSDVVFAYRPRTLRIGALLSAGSVALLIGLLIVPARRRPRGTGDAPSTHAAA